MIKTHKNTFLAIHKYIYKHFFIISLKNLIHKKDEFLSLLSDYHSTCLRINGFPKSHLYEIPQLTIFFGLDLPHIKTILATILFFLLTIVSNSCIKNFGDMPPKSVI